MANSDQMQIAEYLAIKGVTKCPTVYLNKTVGATCKEDRKELKRHQEVQNAKADARYKRLFHKVFFFLIGFEFLPLTHHLQRLLI